MLQLDRWSSAMTRSPTAGLVTSTSKHPEPHAEQWMLLRRADKAGAVASLDVDPAKAPPRCARAFRRVG